MQRREFLLSAAATGALASSARAGVAAAAAKPAFLWGTAGAAYQIEGGNYASDLWVVEHVKPTIFAEPSGDACDAYHHVMEDIALVAALGFNAHRFSIEWSRIEPAPGQFSQAYLDHYARMVDHCRDQGIAPVVTLNHFTCPRWFAAAGGWLQQDAPELFARYCGKVAGAMAAKVAKRSSSRIGLSPSFGKPCRTLGMLG